MARNTRPTVVVLDGNNDNALQVATELSQDLNVTVVGVGTSEWSRLLRSRYCDVGVTTVPASDPRYPEALLDVVTAHEPDLLVPVGYHSVAAADAIRDRLPDGVSCWLPPSDALATAVDKRATAELAASLDVGTPTDYTSLVDDLDERGRPGGIADLSFPVFVKARHECGKNVTARIDGPSTFWATYDDLVEEADDGVLVQEYVEDDTTYACGLLYERGTPRMVFAHEEVRSIPREGGSGTRVRSLRDPRIRKTARRLLDHLDWHGPALVEFKRRPNGSYVLMEINPKLWASYALASQSGYRFVSTLAARAFDLSERPAPSPRERTAEMVFPLRELYFAAKHGDESLLRSAASLCWPPARCDLNADDLGAWLTPPAAVVGSVESPDADAADGDDDEDDGPPADGESDDRVTLST